jgi:hypothetical protein
VTPKETKEEIARRTGIPRSVVAQVLDCQENILSNCVLQRETCYIGNMLMIRSNYRNFSVILDGGRKIVTRLVVNVKPRKPFRRRLSHGKVRSTNKQ